LIDNTEKNEGLATIFIILAFDIFSAKNNSGEFEAPHS
jgi:hypothetical protein